MAGREAEVMAKVKVSTKPANFRIAQILLEWGMMPLN
jgi:hypothetical protein